MNRRTKTYLLLAPLVTASLVLGQNCGGPRFETVDVSDAVSPSLGDAGFSLADSYGSSGKALLNFEQVFRSMLNLTGQEGAQTAAQTQAFSSTAGSMAEGSQLSLITAPVMLGMATVGGEVCNGALTKEAGLAAGDRVLFGGVDFGKGLDQLSEATYMSTVARLGKAFLYRDLSNEEQALLKSYRTDFIADLAAADRTKTAQTRALLLATCATLISSFDAMTF